MEDSGKKIVIWGKSSDLEKGHCEIPEPIDISIQFDDNRFVQACAGHLHSLVLTSIGCVYTWGWNSSGQLGHGDITDRVVPEAIRSISLFTVVQEKKFVKLSCGNLHTIGITDDGKLYAWGSSAEGQLGNGEFEYQLHPQILIPLYKHRIVDIACGNRHTVCVSDEGTVFSWGKGSSGRLGIGTLENTPIPQELKALRGIRIVQVACGASHSMALSDQGHVFSWGIGTDGCLGIGTDLVVVPFPVTYFLENNITIKSIDAGYYHSAAIATDLTLYTWGWGEHGQLGHGNFDSQQYPKLVERFASSFTTSVSCGGFHTLSITNGICWAWGEGEHYCLGNKKKEKVNIPIEVEAVKNEMVYSVFAGFMSSFAILGGAKQRQSVLINKRLSSSLNIIKKRIEQKQPPKEKLKRNRATSTTLNLYDSQHSIESQSKRWIEKILPHYESFSKTKKHSILRKGIPPSIRGFVWEHKLSTRTKITREEFDGLVEQVQRKSQLNLLGEDGFFNVIDVDVPRTFSRTGQFCMNGPYGKSLTLILQCYSLYRPEIGYVQGMSYLGAVLILHMENFEAFKCLVNIIEDHFFSSLYKMDLDEIFRHIKIYEMLFKKHIPELYQHFKAMEISPEHYLLDWFMTIFEGEVFLYKTALGILKYHSKMLKKSSFEECLTMIRHIPRGINEKDLFTSIESISVPGYVREFIKNLENVGGAQIDEI